MFKYFASFVFSVFASIFLIYFIWESPTLHPKKETRNTTGNSYQNNFDQWNSQIGNYDFPQEIVDTSMSLFKEDNMLSYEEIIELAQKGKLDFIQELWKLRAKCGKEMSHKECNEYITAFLMKNYPEPQNKKLVGIFDKYLTYEAHLQELSFPEGANSREKFEILKEKRRSIFGEEEAKLIFGLDESKFEYAEAFPKFLEETKGKSGAEKLEKYEQMRKNIFGSYYETILENESKYTKYTMEVMLKDDDLKSMDTGDKNNAVRSMREKYFGEEGADRIEKVEKELAEEKEKEKSYNEDKKKLLSENPDMTDKEKEKKLNDLRVKYFGKEGAENYKQREALSKLPGM
ncbi:MAG: lipase chaperone [Leptospiraceae bacterium]|nr:lipase chaperone [Leptospiraceae bacterium]MCP5497228.1 lipase chaperone [Leptospiraceae bacterium]